LKEANMTKRKSKLKFPDQKISDTLLRFAEPILDDLEVDATEAEMEPVLMVAWMAWNAVVYADAVGERDLLEQFQAAMAEEPELKRFADLLIDRKRTLFGDDERVIGEYKLYRKDGEIRLRAEARDPRTKDG
jgi:hypothetical protein